MTHMAGEITEVDILREIGSIGAGNATIALSELIQQKILITLPGIYIISPEKVPKLLGFHEMPVVIIYKRLQENDNCDILLVFEKEEANKIVLAVAKNTFGIEDIDEEMKKSIIKEVGNIVIGAFLSAISNFTDMRLLPEPPIHVKDIFDAILEVFLTKLCIQNRKAMVFKTCFKKEEGEIYGAIILFLSDKLQEDLIKRGREWLEG